MRRRTLSSALVAATAFVVLGALAPATVLAQQPAPAQQPAKPSPPKAYKPVPIQLPKPVADPSFEAFRKQLAGIAQKKDRAALARVVSQSFFWIPEDKDVADKKKPAVDNLARAIGLDAKDAPGWDLLAGYAEEPTADADPQRAGVLCGPGEATFDDKAAEDLAKVTQTDPSEWGYPASNGIEVRGSADPKSAVTDKLGLYLVRVYPDDSPAAAVQGGEMLRIVLPSGKLGYVPADQILPLATDQLCYAKEANVWKIAGMIGGYAGPQPQ